MAGLDSDEEEFVITGPGAEKVHSKNADFEGPQGWITTNSTAAARGSTSNTYSSCTATKNVVTCTVVGQ